MEVQGLMAAAAEEVLVILELQWLQKGVQVVQGLNIQLQRGERLVPAVEEEDLVFQKQVLMGVYMVVAVVAAEIVV
jgi:hypothetical protein